MRVLTGAFLTIVFLAAVLWALAVPVFPQQQQQLTAEDQQRIVERMQAEVALLERQRGELDDELGQRREQLRLVVTVLQTNAALSQRVRQLAPPSPAGSSSTPTSPAVE